jgi:hypothetical protein
MGNQLRECDFCLILMNEDDMVQGDAFYMLFCTEDCKRRYLRERV